MKKLGLIFTALLMTLATVSATEKISEKPASNLDINRYRYAQPIQFVERGVEFLIFPDGSFDFNTQTRSAYYSGDMYYKSTFHTRRQSVNVTYGAPRTTIDRISYAQPRNSGVRIEHDADGKVRRIGNVFINYDRTGKIKRAGSVYMDYNRGNGLLTQVGGLHINYNRWGQIVHSHGNVNQYNTSSGFSNTYDTGSFYNTHDDNWNDDSDFYYYKQGRDVKKQKKLKK